jgi:hypothetical protein
MRRWIRDPLTGFVVAAAAVFALYGGNDDRAREISITEADIDRLKESFELVWLRPPTEEELQGLIEDRVREEIFYREARALGLDRDDPVVRDRLRELALDELGEDSQTILARYTVLVESGETRSR